VTTRRLVIEVPISTCVACGEKAEGHVTHVFGNDDGTAAVDIDPPAGWIRLQPHSRLPEGIYPRTFDICAGCYADGPANGSRRTRATFEAVPA
jgi:hypothetical protein